MMTKKNTQRVETGETVEVKDTVHGWVSCKVLCSGSAGFVAVHPKYGAQQVLHKYFGRNWRRPEGAVA